MPIPQQIALGLRQRSGSKILLRHASSSPPSSTSTPGSVGQWSTNSTLPGGFSADGLREWATLTDFGADGYENQTRQDIRRRKMEYDRYADLFSTRVSDGCSNYLASRPCPSDVLGRAFFGSRSFMTEKIFLSSMNSIFHLYPEGSTILPAQFNMNDRFLHWKVSSKSPLEIIYTYQIDGLHFRGCTMLAYDPSLNKVYHGNCIDVSEERVNSSLGIRIHVHYAKYLLGGMVSEMEILSRDAQKS
ncbi:hypothetical protein ACHAWU_000171 [Discostella pseudostelligera]|uniref:Uncharacterized protein n=1 Tax=Discostella pseudostelligera TaxID=259834 RepID=A0ABD3MUB0_9STRA